MQTADAPSTVGAATLDAWSARVLRCLAPDRRSVIGNALVAAFIAMAAVGHSAIVRLEADTATLDPTASLIPLFICAFAIAYLGCAALTAVLDRVPYRLARRQDSQPAQGRSGPSARASQGGAP